MKFSPKLGVTLAALAALGLAGSHAANAQSAGFQVGVYNFLGGNPPVTYTGTSALLTTPFVPVASGGGTANGITFSLSNGDNGIVYNSSPDPTSDTALVYQQAIYWQPGHATGSVVGTETFSGLTAGSLYDVALYGADSASAWGIETGGVAPATPTVTTTGFTGAPSIAATGGLFKSVAADATGTITVAQYSTGGGSYTEITAVQIAPSAAAVPEASSAIGFGVLLALGGLAVVARKRTVKA